MYEEIFTAYAEHDDITFIMKDTYDENGNPCKTEVIGWYYGEPNEQNTMDYMGDLIAEYN